MAKAISSATDVLAALAGKTKLFEIEGVTIELRALEWAEAETLYAEYGDKPAEMTYQAARMGISAPVFDEAQLAQLRKAMPGAIQKISSEVMAMSGMAPEEGGRPLAGSGSVPLPETAAPT